MRISVPVGNSGVRVQTGCILTPVMLLVYAVFGGVVLAFYMLAAMFAVIVLIVAWTAYAVLWCYWNARIALARRKIRKHGPVEPPKGESPESPARYSNRR